MLNVLRKFGIFLMLLTVTRPVCTNTSESLTESDIYSFTLVFLNLQLSDRLSSDAVSPFNVQMANSSALHSGLAVST